MVYEINPSVKAQLNRTSESEFKLPILRAIYQLGGKASLQDVLTLVKYQMQEILTRDDNSFLSSSPNKPRWVKTAQWAKNQLVNSNLLRRDSPRGYWEITEDGLSFLSISLSSTLNEYFISSMGLVPVNLYCVTQVCSYVTNKDYSFFDACVYVSKKLVMVSPSDVSNACTLYLNLSLDQFYDLLINKQKLFSLLVSYFPDYVSFLEVSLNY